MSRLDGRVVALAGATGGLGPHVAQAFVEAGAALALADVSEERLGTLAEELPAGSVHTMAVDLLDEDATAEWAHVVAATFGRVDGLLHLVGGWRGGQDIDQADLADWDLLHGLLVRTVQHTTRAFRRHLLASEHGRFALVSAVQARRPTRDNAAYAAAKAAAEAWTMALADSFADADATANVVVVNAIVTPQMRAANPDKEYRTFTDAEEIAATLVYLCSDAARKMNGQRIELHG